MGSEIVIKSKAFWKLDTRAGGGGRCYILWHTRICRSNRSLVYKKSLLMGSNLKRKKEKKKPLTLALFHVCCKVIQEKGAKL